jgi:hypothetical protein
MQTSSSSPHARKRTSSIGDGVMKIFDNYIKNLFLFPLIIIVIVVYNLLLLLLHACWWKTRVVYALLRECVVARERKLKCCSRDFY